MTVSIKDPDRRRFSMNRTLVIVTALLLAALDAEEENKS